MIFGSYLVVKVLVDLCEVVDVGLVDPLLVVQPLSLQVQLGQILKIKMEKIFININQKLYPACFTFSKNFMTFFMLSPLPVKRGESMSRPTILEN